MGWQDSQEVQSAPSSARVASGWQSSNVVSAPAPTGVPLIAGVKPTAPAMRPASQKAETTGSITDSLPSIEQVDHFLGVGPGQTHHSFVQPLISRGLHAAKDALGLVDRGARAVVGSNVVDAASDPALAMLPGIGEVGPALSLGTKSSVAASKLPAIAADVKAAASSPVTRAVVAAKATEKLTEGPTGRWVKNQAKTNPYAAYDAEVVSDLKGLTTNRATVDTNGKLISPKGRAPVSVKDIDNLEQSYQNRFKDMVNGLDLPPSEKLRLKGALDMDYSASMDLADSLKGTVAGDAIRHVIIKTQRLRDMTKETPPGGWRAMVRTAAQAAGAAAPVVAGGPAGAVLSYPGIALARAATRGLVGGEASRVNMATKFINQADRYAKLGEKVGPSGAIESQDALKALHADVADGAYADKVDKGTFQDAFPTAGTSLPKTPGAPTILSKLQKQTGFKLGTVDNKLAGFDAKLAKGDEAAAKVATKEELAAKAAQDISDVEDARASRIAERQPPVSVARQKLADAQAATGFDPAAKQGPALAKWQKDFDTATAPPKVEKVKALNPTEQAIADNIAKGIPGNTGTQDYFAEHVLGGVDKADAVRAAEAVGPQYPGFSHELAKFKAGYNTAKGFKQAVGPAMRKYLEMDGTLAKAAEARKASEALAATRKAAEKKTKPAPAVVPIDTEAQAHLAQVEAANTKTGLEATRRPTQARLPEVAPTPAKSVEAPVEAPQAAPEAPPNMEDSTTPAGKPRHEYKPVTRQAEFNEAKDRNIATANKAFDDLYGDVRLPSELFDHGFMEGLRDKIVHGFKTKEEAHRWLEEEFLPSIPDDIASATDKSRLASHISQAIDAKPHATRAALEAAIRANPRGRPRKN